MEIPFVKLQGNGNDFVLIDELAGKVIPDDMKGDFAKLYCDRRFGIGADGILFISKPQDKTADIRMRLFQPDASEAEMCGNGIRCLAKYAFDKKSIGGSARIETMAGVLEVECGYEGDEFSASIDMGRVLWERGDIPATGSGDYEENIGGFTVNAANTGVPHAVIFIDDLEGLDICAVAPQIRHHSSFPKGTNVNFAKVTGKDEITIRTFERGVEGETYSCGTGSTASAAIAFKTGRTGNVVHVNTKGGPLTITIEDGRARMTGPATTVFSGSFRM
ncbi:MAG: diaminopimelate epimerase [Methanomicrobium sp.]|nr:diaminopimelate epimerase [Methanomicrobium sp.]